MVFAANGATVIDGRVLGALFAYRERYAEAEAHREWFRADGWTDIHEPDHVNEGEGDFAVTASYLLAGRGFRSSPLSHGEAQEFFGRPVIGLDLVDPRYYHLDTALCVLDDAADEIMYYPGRSRRAAGPCWPASSRTRSSPRRRTPWRWASTRSATDATCCSRRPPWGCWIRCGTGASNRFRWIWASCSRAAAA